LILRKELGRESGEERLDRLLLTVGENTRDMRWLIFQRYLQPEVSNVAG
jgi:hypothetical protein